VLRADVVVEGDEGERVRVGGVGWRGRLAVAEEGGNDDEELKEDQNSSMSFLGWHGLPSSDRESYPRRSARCCRQLLFNLVKTKYPTFVFIS